MAELLSITGLELGILLIFTIITLLINSIALWLATKLLKFKKKDFRTALTVVAITFVIFIPSLIISYNYTGLGVSTYDILVISIIIFVSLPGSFLIFPPLIMLFYGVRVKEARLAWSIVLGVFVAIVLGVFLAIQAGIFFH